MDYEEDAPEDRMPDKHNDDGLHMTGAKFLLAFFLPFVIDGVLTPLLREAAMFVWVLAAWVGFYFLTKGCTQRTQGLIAIVYFPFMIVALLVASFFVPGLGIPIHGE